jgi:1-acyl-sn-glycerol-3-phosphate acyltransferase
MQPKITLPGRFISGLQRALGTVLINGAFNIRVNSINLSNLYPLHKKGILAANHTSFLDIASIVYTNPYPVYFMASPYFGKNKYIRKYLQMQGHIILEKNGFMDKTLPLAKKRSSEGFLCIFPEGTRNTTDKPLLRLRSGVDYLAEELNLPVVPVAIKGARQTWPRGQFFSSYRGNITVTYGQPIYPPNGNLLFTLQTKLEEMLLN